MRPNKIRRLRRRIAKPDYNIRRYIEELRSASFWQDCESALWERFAARAAWYKRKIDEQWKSA